ncbi:MAG: hypothetical protein LBH65_03450 [Desulfovibrio sp.]|nr:hypothetical protein [Desulfovibrio sp.]
MHRIFFVFLITLVLAAAGCESNQIVKDSWKFTKRQYSTYLNTPASLDMEDKGSCEVYELALGEAVMNIDAELQKLVRAMENSDHNPDQRWVMQMLGRVPWLSGVALVDGQGNVVAQYPELFSKDFDATPLLTPDPKQRIGALRAYAQMHANGPEVYVANPVYGGEEMKGLIVAYFDPAALATMSNDPGSFVLACPAGVIWPGRFGGGVMSGENWEEKLKRQSCGLVGSGKSAFFWTTRWVGNLPIVYGMPVSAAPSVLSSARETPAASNAAPSFDPESTPLAEPEKSTYKQPENASDTPTQEPWHEGANPNPVVVDAPGGQ